MRKDMFRFWQTQLANIQDGIEAEKAKVGDDYLVTTLDAVSVLVDQAGMDDELEGYREDACIYTDRAVSIQELETSLNEWLGQYNVLDLTFKDVELIGMLKENNAWEATVTGWLAGRAEVPVLQYRMIRYIMAAILDGSDLSKMEMLDLIQGRKLEGRRQVLSFQQELEALLDSPGFEMEFGHYLDSEIEKVLSYGSPVYIQILADMEVVND